MPTPYRQNSHARPGGVGPLDWWQPILLFVLPLPLIPTMFTALGSGQFMRFLFSAIGFALFMLAGILLRRGRKYELEQKRRKWSRSTRVPWKMLAALFTAAGAGLVALFVVHHGLLISLSFAAAAFVGMVLAYGLDPQYGSSKETTSLFGVTADEVIDALEEAEENIAEIEGAAKQISNAELKSRLNSIAGKTRGILELIEEDPKDLRRARKFLKVYLENTRKVAEKYARTHKLQENRELEDNFRNAMTSMEEVIDEQREKLLRNDVLDLDIQIEVLETQLKREGVI